jgi:hypothetical protein
MFPTLIDKKTALLLSFLIIILGVSFAFVDRKQAFEDGLRLVDPATFVEEFGEQLRFVPLVGDESIVSEAMRTYYRGYVSSELIAKWEQAPLNAPGRLTSSPYPDRIEVTDIKEILPQKYIVSGNLVEATFGENGKQILRPFVLELTSSENGYLITDFEFGTP